jgi:hypothetical protein
MKIISKFKDYYDIGVSFGIDETIHYLRIPNTEIASKEIDDLLSPPGWTTLNSGNYITSNLIYNTRNIESYFTRFLFFCGKVYPEVNYNYRVGGRVNDQLITKRIIGVDECLEFFKEIEYDFKVNWSKWNRVELFNLVISSLTDKVILDEHIKYQSPTLYYYETGVWEVNINKKLSDIDFYKILDAYQAFQEISMFLGSTLVDVSTPKMPVGDDKVIINSKGFDPKYGFRTRPKKTK